MSKKNHFFKLGQENVLYDILEPKNPFLDHQRKKFKKSKIDIFPKGLTRGFGPKKAIFPIFFLGNLDQENVFYDILKPKNPFLGYQRKTSKKSKNWHFSQLFFLGSLDQENVFYDILERKNAFLGYKNKKFKNSKNWHFSKGVNPWFWSKNGHFSNFFF